MHCCSCFRHVGLPAAGRPHCTPGRHQFLSGATLPEEAGTQGQPARSRRPCPIPRPDRPSPGCQHPVRVCSAAMHRVECSAQQAKVGVGGGTKEVRPGEGQEAITELIFSQRPIHHLPAPQQPRGRQYTPAQHPGSGSPGAPGRRHAETLSGWGSLASSQLSVHRGSAGGLPAACAPSAAAGESG